MFDVALTNQLCLVGHNSEHKSFPKPIKGPYVYACKTISVLTPQGTRSCNINLIKTNNDLIVEMVSEDDLIGRVVFVSSHILNNPSIPHDVVGLYNDFNLIYDCWLENRSPMALKRDEEEEEADDAKVKELRQRISESKRRCDESERAFHQTYGTLFNFNEKVIGLATTASVKAFAAVFFFFSSAFTWRAPNCPSLSYQNYWHGIEALPYQKGHARNHRLLNNENNFHLWSKSAPAFRFDNNHRFKLFAYSYQTSNGFFHTRKYAIGFPSD